MPKKINLPQPQLKGKMSLEESIKGRETTRHFKWDELSLNQISQLLWSLQGVIVVIRVNDGSKIYHRTAPSAGRSYPLEIYALLESGVYLYNNIKHDLTLKTDEDRRNKLSNAAVTQINQMALKNAPVTFVITAVNEKALKVTPLMEDAIRYVYLEVGHATQNFLLQAVSLGLGSVTITSFNPAKVFKALNLSTNCRPIYLLPAGYPKKP